MNPLHDEPDVTPATEPKVDLGRRFLAFLIDSVAASVAGVIVGVFSPVLGAVVTAGYMILRDGVDVGPLSYRSLGKHLLKLRPVRLDGHPVDLETSLRRNWMFGIGSLAQIGLGFGLGAAVSIAGTILLVYEIYRVVTDPAGRRWGDELAGTQVIDATP